MSTVNDNSVRHLWNAYELLESDFIGDVRPRDGASLSDDVEWVAVSCLWGDALDDTARWWITRSGEIPDLAALDAFFETMPYEDHLSLARASKEHWSAEAMAKWKQLAPIRHFYQMWESVVLPARYVIENVAEALDRDGIVAAQSVLEGFRDARVKTYWLPEPTDADEKAHPHVLQVVAIAYRNAAMVAPDTRALMRKIKEAGLLNSLQFIYPPASLTVPDD